MAIVQEKKQKLNFQDGCHLGFLIDMILAILDLQVTPMLPTMFQVNWPFNSEEAKKQIFKTAATVDILDFRSEQFKYFLSTSHPNASSKVSSQVFVCVEVLRPFKSSGLLVQEK